MGSTEHTPGPWSLGRTLKTRTTKQWTPEEVAANDEIEARMVFAFFTPEDEGRGRRLIATCERREDARLIAAAPELLEALMAAVECGMVPISSAKEGGAMAYVKQAQVADLIRAAIAKAVGHD